MKYGQRLLTKEQREAAKAARIQHIKTAYVNAEITEHPGVTIAKYERTAGALFSCEWWTGNAGNSEEKIYRSAEQRDRCAANVISNAASRLQWKEKRKEENKGKSSSHAAAAAALRTELKTAFPGIRFSVTSDSFAGGDAVRVSWTDGPTTAEVKEFSGKYQYGNFNGMEDIYEYTNSREDIPQAKYVTESRSASDEITEQIKAALIAGKHLVEDFGHWSTEQRIYRIFAATSLPVGAKITGLEDGPGNDPRAIVEAPKPEPETERPTPVEVPAGKIQVIEYSDKALAVIGDTRTIKEKLKELGGRFNPRLTCGPGWIFSKKQADQLKSAFM
jgi:hypothetical protein